MATSQKIFFGCLVFIASFLLIILPCPAATNLLTDPGFDNRSPYEIKPYTTPWWSYAANGGGWVCAERPSSRPNSAKLYVWGTSKCYSICGQTVTGLIAGKHYELSASLYRAMDIGLAYASLKVEWTNSAKSVIQTNEFRVFDNNSTPKIWKTVLLDVASPQGASGAKVSVVLNRSAGTANTTVIIYADDISFKQIEDRSLNSMPGPDDLLLNPTFNAQYGDYELPHSPSAGYPWWRWGGGGDSSSGGGAWISHESFSSPYYSTKLFLYGDKWSCSACAQTVENIVPGRPYKVSAEFYRSMDIGPSASAVIKVEWLDSSGSNIAIATSESETIFDNTCQPWTWKTISSHVMSPEGASKANFEIIFKRPDKSAGEGTRPTVNIYVDNCILKEWKSQMFGTHDQASVESLGGKLYVNSGSLVHGGASLIETYNPDPSLDSWTSANSGFQGADAVSFVLNNEIYYTNGYNLSKYNPASMAWTSLGILPSTITPSCSAVIDQTAYLLDADCTTLYKYTGSWATIDIPSGYRIAGTQMVSYKGKLYFFTPDYTMDTNYEYIKVYDPVTNTWTIGPLVTADLYSDNPAKVVPVLFGNHALFFRSNADGALASNVHMYSFVSKSWKRVDLTQFLPVGAAITLNNGIGVIGNYAYFTSNQNLTSDVYKINLRLIREKTKPYNMICYGPFRANQVPGGAEPTPEQVKEDLAILSELCQGIRLYGNDGVLNSIPEWCEEYGLTCWPCAWIEPLTDQYGQPIPGAEARNQARLDRLIETASLRLAGTEGLIVGSEVLVALPTHLGYINTVKNGLISRGLTLPVTSAQCRDTWKIYPELVNAVDMIFLHDDPSWSPSAAEKAHLNVMDDCYALMKKYPGKKLILGESGWPSAGETLTVNGVSAVPSEANQQLYVNNMARSAKNIDLDCFVFEGFNEPYKAGSEPRNWGPNWGLFYVNRTPKPLVPQFPDSDDDGATDATEAYYGSDPLNSDSMPKFRIYVNCNSTVATPDGMRWETAFRDLQDALEIAGTGAEIWVAKGTYRPSQTGDSNASFVLMNNVTLYGGFFGNEKTRGQRNYKTNKTILSGDLAGDDVPGQPSVNKIDNSHHVVVSFRTNATAVLDGFVITGGWADGDGDNTEWKDSSAGGGIYNISGMPTISNCLFIANAAGYSGGGMHNDQKGDWHYKCKPTLINCAFIANGSGYGGAIYTETGSIVAINCTVYKNNANYDIGGYYNHDGDRDTITNCIFWENTDNWTDDQIGIYGDVTYSDIQEGYLEPGTGCIRADPLFVDPDGIDNILGTPDDDLRLMEGSPCIDAGNSSAVSSNRDLYGTLRFLDDPLKADTGVGQFPIVDMGAYEHN